MQDTTPEPIDIHHHQAKLERELQAVRNDERLNPENRGLIARFVQDARIGRTIRRGARRRLSPARCRKLLTTLRTFGLAVHKPFREVTLEDVERFIIGIEDGLIDKRIGVGGTRRYSPATVLDFKKILKKLFVWMYEDDPGKAHELTGWFDTRDWAPELKTFGLEDVRRMAMAAPGPQGRALVLLLFDSGMRAGELFNVRLQDLQFRQDGAGQDVCFVRITVSKTRPRTISLPLATEAVRFWAERHPAGGRVDPDGRVQAQEPSATLITWSYHYCRKVVAELGRSELGTRLYLHRFRHASATFYAKRLNAYQLTARFGWTMGSRAVQRYIDHSGVLAEDVARLVRDELSSTRQPATSVHEFLEGLQRSPALAETLRAVLQMAAEKRNELAAPRGPVFSP